MRCHRLRTLPCALALALALGVGACSDGQPPAHGRHGPPRVGVYRLRAKPYTLTTTLPGRTGAYMISEVRPQVDGIIQKRLFREGSDVKAGQVLYQIDPAKYRAAFDSAKAQLAQAKATVASARPMAERYRHLAKIDAVSKQAMDNAVAALAQNKANVAAAKAKLETARINLGYTKIRAPISGRIGKSDYTPGALVTANQSNALATINRLDPIYVDIQQTSSQFLKLRNALRSGRLETVGPKQARVTIAPEDDAGASMQGRLEFAGVTVDQDAGTVTLRAIVPNPNENLLPGMYVNARLAQGVDREAILVPQQAVSRSSSGQASCLVVGPNNNVLLRNITIAGAADGNRWRVTAGLKSGERVIVQGIDKAKPGETVRPVAVTFDNGRVKTVPGPEKTHKPRIEANGS